MGMDVSNKWYAEAQRYNDVINPQNGNQFNDKDWGNYGRQMMPPGMGPVDSESKLSAGAQDYLEKLRKSFADSNMEFVVAESTDSAEAKAKLSNTGKEFTVLLTNEEIEHMAWDVKYRTDTLQKIKSMKTKLTDSKDKDMAQAKGLASDEVMRVSLTGTTYGATKKATQIDKIGASPMPAYMDMPKPPRMDENVREKRSHGRDYHKKGNRPVRTEPHVSKSQEHMRKTRNAGRKH